MGAFVSGYWPAITDEPRDSMPGFYNDCCAWGNWMAERYNHPEVLDTIKRLGVSALLSHMTDGMEENEVEWVSPDELMNAADRLRELVLAQDPHVENIVDTYALSANEIDPVHEEFAQDLLDVHSIARIGKEMDIQKMTLEVNW